MPRRETTDAPSSRGRSVVDRAARGRLHRHRQAVTKHLHVLAGAGLVRDARRGRDRIWELEPDKLAEARRTLDEISKRWDEPLDHLKRYVEE